jgi:hypothetical protein
VIDANYFKRDLPRDVSAVGGEPVVELFLLNGHVLRVRAVLDVGDGWVTLEAYHARGDLAHHRPRYGAASSPDTDAASETFRAAIAYESIAAVMLDPTPSQVRSRPGFGSD